MATSKLYDTLIIGSGPGGLSTALGLGRQNRTCLVVSHNLFRNDGIEASHGVLGHDHIHPRTIWAKGQEQIKRYGNTSYVEAEIVLAEKQKISQWNGREGFMIKSKDSRSWTGKTMVLATGVRDLLPNLNGYRENWPRNIYQCLFCDGWERRHDQKAVLAIPEFNMQCAKMASMALGLDIERNNHGSAKVTILTNGPFNSEAVDSTLAKQARALAARGVKIDQRKIVNLENAEPGKEGVHVHFEDDNQSIERVFFGFIVHKPETALNAEHLIQQLGIETEQGMWGAVMKTQAPMQATNVPGVFAAGDSGNLMTHVTTAMTSGIGAASGIVHYLNELDDEVALVEVGYGRA
ncbi:hypothetical protein H2198_007775 [Neophaeococcomyces mojaviensis]|uniref:Uncharacterized protein n=1 Tax=Neophaeococcomyces mojaviensis TaxID=3383035 RepID=A0ACC2ZZ48_9EURO|nr:hypothetical protein H2198_007775 [Knufia sp. JES_112]